MKKKVTITEQGTVYCSYGECDEYKNENYRCKGCPLVYVLAKM